MTVINGMWILFLCLFAYSTNGQHDQAIKQAETLCEKAMADGNLPGLAVAVYFQGDHAWHQGFGFADIENGVPVDPASSVFRIGSVSKTLTGVGMMKLVEDAKIVLEEDIRTYVEEFPQKEYPVTVAQLCQHIGGIRHYQGLEFMSNVNYHTVREGLAIFINDPLINEPGTKYSYSSYGWNLVSAAMESAANEEFLSFMQSTVFKPLSMNSTQAEIAADDIPGLVSFYEQQDGENIVAPAVDNSYKWAGGGFVSTATDLIEFGRQVALVEKTFLSAESLKVAWEPATLKDGTISNYGIGWRLGEDNKGRRWVGHSGGSVGGSSMFLVYPEHDLIVVTLVNQSQARTGNLPFRIAEQFIAHLEE